MNARLFALPFVVLGSMLLAAGCTLGVDAGPADGYVTLVCVPDNAACGHDDDCCSDVCASDGFCGVPVGACLEDNSACDDDGACCSGVCASDGRCGFPATVVEVTCSADDAPCSTDTDCCSFLCASDGACGAADLELPGRQRAVRRQRRLLQRPLRQRRLLRPPVTPSRGLPGAPATPWATDQLNRFSWSAYRRRSS